MKAEVFVTLKRGVLDPQGKDSHHAIETVGYTGIADVRQGKYFEIEVGDGLSPEAARAELDRIAREILSNPVIEDYRVEIKS
jgi:phosphoribosylformylglycinamidine synthase